MILMKDIIREGHPTLNKVSSEVKLPLNKNDIELGLKLHKFVVNSQDPILSKKYDLRPAVGIAAPQINVDRRMFAVYFNDLDDTLFSYIIINPVIISRSDVLTYLPNGEGCLSVDRDVEGITPRNLAIHIKAQNLNPETLEVSPIDLQLFGYPAIVFQHEFDHLEGVLFTSKVFPDLPNAKPLFTEEDNLDDE